MSNKNSISEYVRGQAAWFWDPQLAGFPKIAE